MDYNIYCDESCHLENDKEKYMILGGIICEKVNRRKIRNVIQRIKNMNNIKPAAEIKWNKVSTSKIEYYKQLVNFF